ncbi:MAG TPA: YbfB/YjiJ family MFS transporter [Candidatus Elarobacter sp.]|jgi:predicted MFS family arabinose efflux permease|nr:YbfB/YjiJ family MFS transporter [Candidatus Elarobacter sp.]
MARSVVLWSVVAITVDIGLARLGYGLVLPAIRNDIAGSFSAFGLVATLHFAGYLSGSLAVPFVLRRDVTARYTATFAHALVGVTLIASALSRTLAELTIARAIMGLGCGLGVAAVITGALERVGAAQRAGVSGRAWSGIAVGLFLSAPATPWLLGGADRWRAGTLITGAIGLVAAIGLWFAFAQRPLTTAAAQSLETPFRLLDVLKPRRYLFLAIGYFGFGAAYTAYSTFIVAALRSYGLGTAAIAAVWLAFGVTALIGALSVGRIAGGRLRLAAFALSLGIAAVGALFGLLPSVAAAVIGALCVGLGLASSPAIASAMARARSSAATGAAAFVAVTTIMSVGQVLGPIVAGAAADRFGPAIVPLVAFVIYAGGSLAAAVDGIFQRVPDRATLAEAG